MDRLTAYGHSWVAGEGAVGDDENHEVRWWPTDALPDMPERFASRVHMALADEPQVRLGALPAGPPSNRSGALPAAGGKRNYAVDALGMRAQIDF